jgi:hypothetical protein
MSEGAAEETVVMQICAGMLASLEKLLDLSVMSFQSWRRENRCVLMSFREMRICLADPHQPNRAGLQTIDSRYEQKQGSGARASFPKKCKGNSWRHSWHLTH